VIVHLKRVMLTTL